MKGRHVIAMMVLAHIWTTPFCWAMGEADQPQAKNSEAKTLKAEKTAKEDGDVADSLEMLQFMDMLEHFDLIKDLDVLEGGEK